MNLSIFIFLFFFLDNKNKLEMFMKFVNLKSYPVKTRFRKKILLKGWTGLNLSHRPLQKRVAFQYKPYVIFQTFWVTLKFLIYKIISLHKPWFLKSSFISIRGCPIWRMYLFAHVPIKRCPNMGILIRWFLNSLNTNRGKDLKVDVPIRECIN